MSPPDAPAVAGYASVVCIDPALSHLGRAFTYAIPADLAAGPGSVVKIPFRGRNRTGVVVDVAATSDVDKALPIASLAGPGLEPADVDLARWLADRYLATLGEALATLVPKRVVSEEGAPPAGSPRPDGPAGSPFDGYRGAEALRDALGARGHHGFLIRPLAEDRIPAIIEAARAVALDGGGVIVLVPEVRVATDLRRAMVAAFGEGVAWLGSDLPARARYRAWLDLRSGEKRIAFGGRAAVFAPVHDLRLIVVDDEGHAAYKEGRAPRFHARTVADERARRAGATVMLIGVPGSVEARAASDRGPYGFVAAPRARERAGRPPVTVVEREAGERLVPGPRTLTMARKVLSDGGRVMLITHRGGEAAAAVAERTIRILAPRSPVVLDARGATASIARTASRSDLVIATPVIAKDLSLASLGLLALVDVDAALAQPEFRAAEDAFSVWWRAARWVSGAIAVETAEATHPAIVALVRWDPDVLWRWESSKRTDLRYPPYASLARIDLPIERADEVAAELLAAGVEVLGPVEREHASVLIVRADRRAALLDGLRPFVSRWREADEPMRVDVDPWEVFVPKWRS